MTVEQLATHDHWVEEIEGDEQELATGTEDSRLRAGHRRQKGLAAILEDGGEVQQKR